MKKITFDNVITAIKNKKFKEWFYKFKTGHPFLLKEEVDIICNTRDDQKYMWMNDEQIQKIVRVKVEAMYKKKYPDAKQWSLSNF